MVALQGHRLVVETDDFAGTLLLVTVDKTNHITQGHFVAAHLQNLPAFECVGPQIEILHRLTHFHTGLTSVANEELPHFRHGTEFELLRILNPFQCVILRLDMLTKTFTSGRIRKADYDPASRQLDLHWDNKSVLAYKHVPQEVYRRLCSAPNPTTYWEDRIAEEYPKGIPMMSGAAADGVKKFNDLFGSAD